ncbi:hypothetical protein FHS15_001309 [Paenibacillus castaneae]|uniref:hypothetical protein n=1 Tax=Paenibacillus castaneae TaxID=474957 RepID=UPI000C9C768D|nr:hypothetical protein [Paenibacillus castaneae]NIK76202.1 hypothetical protein [Paenibacillus castaneae]
MSKRMRSMENKEFTIYVLPAWKWKEFLAFELIGGAAFYLFCRITAHSELFGIAANIAGPQMLKYVMASYRPNIKKRSAAPAELAELQNAPFNLKS